MTTVNYKGYQAQVEYDDNTLFVKILHISDLLIAECEKASEVEAVARDLIDTYLEDCRELGKAPERPFKGSFNVRVTPEMHKRAAMAAANAQTSLNNWVSRAMQEKLDCSKFSDRLDGIIKGSRDELAGSLVRHAGNPSFNRQTRVKLTWSEEPEQPAYNVLMSKIGNLHS